MFDGAPPPPPAFTTFCAMTRKAYSVPLVRPVTVQPVPEPVVADAVQFVPAVLCSTV